MSKDQTVSHITILTSGLEHPLLDMHVSWELSIPTALEYVMGVLRQEIDQAVLNVAPPTTIAITMSVSPEREDDA